MSTRALKKHQEKLDSKINELKGEQQSDDDIDENEENENENSTAVNRFAMLNDSADENQPSNVDTPAVITDDHTASVKNAKKKSKAKTKKKQKIESTTKKHENIDEILKELGAEIRPTENINAATVSASKNDEDGEFFFNETSLFQIEYRNLNPEFEMKRIFGKTILDAGEERRSVQKVLRKTGHQGKRFGGKLVKPKNNQIVGKIGLTMELVESLPGGCNLFAFQHNLVYQQAQLKFWDGVESMSPDSFLAILQDHPFHVDTLLQMSDVYKINEDFSYARDLVERAIFACEAAFHPLFNVALNNSRLDYKQQENRSFFLALFKHMQYMCQRHCYRTALEFCKLIYSLDPDEDPLGMLLIIDYLCLRCRHYEYLINLYHILEAKRNLSQLPNFAFSVALAMHMKNLESSSDTVDLFQADKKLQEALTQFPTVLVPLLDRCSVEPDKDVAKSEAFSLREQLRDGKGLTQLISLYVARCHHIWKDGNIMSWLEVNVRQVLPTLNSDNEAYKECCTNRQNRYQTPPLNVLRHVVLSEIKEALASLPPEIRQKSITNYDPLPPPDSRCAYSKPQRPPREPGSGSFFGSLFRSLLPNYNPDTDVANNAEVGVAAAAAAGGGNELQRSVHALLQAMRDLLNDLQPAALPDGVANNPNGENQDNAHDDEWEDDWEVD